MGIKREGLLYLEKYSTGGPEFGIKEEFVTERPGEGSSSMPMHEQGGLLSTARPTDQH